MNVILLLVTVVFSLYSMELVFRWMGEDLTSPEPFISYLPKPWGAILAPSIAPDQINSFGVFDVEHTLLKSVNTVRVVTLGDSFLGLPALPQTKQVPQLLQGLLNQNRLADAKVSYEVLNFSVSSAGTANEYLRYMLDARRFNPDVVLVYFTVSNDMRNNSVLLQPLCEAASIDLPGFVLDKDHKLQQVTIPAAPGSYVYYRSPLAHWLVQRSALYRRATRALQVLKGARSAVSPPAQWAITVSFLQQPYTPAVADAWNVTEALLCALREEAAKDRARVGVVLIPTAWDIELAWKEWLLQQLPPTLTTASLDFDLPYNEAIRRLTRWHIPVLDLRTPFRKALRDAPTELLYDTT